MKYLLVLALVFIVFWLWRSARGDRSDRSRPPAAPEPGKQEPAEVVECDYCHVHLPRTEALVGRNGIFCSDAHRREAGS
jgi:uncharacterized protein